MKVLVLNGSPKKDRSNTIQVTNAFVSGFPEGTEVKKINIYEKDIKPCQGCFACWASPDGTCAIKDDMAEIIAAIKEADANMYEDNKEYYRNHPKMDRRKKTGRG